MDAATNEQRRARIFCHVASNITEEGSAGQIELIDHNLGSLPIDHVTEYPFDPCWFQARQNCATLSGVQHHFPILSRYWREAGIVDDSTFLIEQYLSTASEVGRGDGVGLDAITEHGGDENIAATGNVGGNVDEEDASSNAACNDNIDAALVDPVSNETKDIVGRLSSDADYCTLYLSGVKSKNDKELQDLVRALGRNLQATKAANSNSIKKWVDAQPCERPYILMTVHQRKKAY